MTRHPRHDPASVARAAGAEHGPTPEQAKVIAAPLRPLLVVAGAGSGKTETMAQRVVWLVANGLVAPERVLGLTFTRKAAAELADRVGDRLRRLRLAGLWEPEAGSGAPAGDGTPTVTTYHGYAGQLVRDHGLRHGYEPHARLLTPAGAWQYAADVVSRYAGDMTDVDYEESSVIAAVVDLAGELAEHLLTPAELRDELDAVLGHLTGIESRGPLKGEPVKMRSALRARRALVPLLEGYAEAKRRRESLDFADEVSVAAHLARRHPDIGRLERARYAAVLLDEYQDTSQAQADLMAALFAAPGEPVPVTAVGDPHQSIYGWRGASADALRWFPDQFADDAGPARVLHLSTSWRNDRTVLTVANEVAGVLRQSSRIPVVALRPAPAAGAGSVDLARLETHHDEADYVATWLTGLRLDRETSAAVLCRRRSQFGAVVAALERAGIPHEVVGLGGLLTTPEVQDLVAVLRAVHDPTRGDAVMRLLTGASCRLDAADLDALAAWARQRQAVARHEASGRLPLELPSVAALHEEDGRDAPGGEPDPPRPVDLAPDSIDDPSLVEAIADLPPPGWCGRDGETLSPWARQRLAWLAEVLLAARREAGQPVPDLVAHVERVLGLDIEVLARPEYPTDATRAHLDAFADVAEDFAGSSDRPTLGGFLAWLDVAADEERGLDQGVIEPTPGAVQVLTIHAAKGLEWDHVAIPGLVEGTLPARTATAAWKHGSWQVSEPTATGWTSGLAGVPNQLRGDAAGLPQFDHRAAATPAALSAELSRFRRALGQHEVEEERRLLYVALTRARHRVLLTAPVWMETIKPKVLSRFATELLENAEAIGLRVGPLAAMPPEGASNPAAADPPRVSWPADPLGTRREALDAAAAAVCAARDGARAPDPGDPRLAEARLLLAEAAAQEHVVAEEVDLPRHLSASAMVALATDQQQFARRLRRPEPVAPATSARRGTAFHAWVERHYARAAFLDVTDLPGSADEQSGDDADLPRLIELFLASPWAQRQPVAVEAAIETVLDGLAVRARIDAVFPRQDGGFTVVDWKTGAAPPPTRAAARAVQLGVYALAYRRLHRLAVDEVDAAFYYASTGQTIYPVLPEESDLLQLLRSVPEAAAGGD